MKPQHTAMAIMILATSAFISCMIEAKSIFDNVIFGNRVLDAESLIAISMLVLMLLIFMLVFINFLILIPKKDKLLKPLFMKLLSEDEFTYLYSLNIFDRKIRYYTDIPRININDCNFLETLEDRATFIKRDFLSIKNRESRLEKLKNKILG